MGGTKASGADVVCTPAQHFSARGIGDRNRTLWGGFAVSVAGKTSTSRATPATVRYFREIGRACRQIDVALVPIGAYDPRWFMAPVHVNPDEAVRIHFDRRGARQHRHALRHVQAD